MLHKAGGSVTTLTWQQAVEEGLCFGWIDSQAGRRDEGSYTVRFTPRRPRSMWSARNVGLVAELERSGRMQPAGRIAVEAAKADGRWAAAYAGPATATVPDDLAAAVAADPRARLMFEILTKANRFALIGRLGTLKRAATRERLIGEMVAALARGETPYPQKAKP